MDGRTLSQLWASNRSNELSSINRKVCCKSSSKSTAGNFEEILITIINRWPIFTSINFSFLSSSRKQINTCVKDASKVLRNVHESVYISKGHFRLVSVYRIKVVWIIHEVHSSPHFPIVSHTDSEPGIFIWLWERPLTDKCSTNNMYVKHIELIFMVLTSA